ncbi:glycosyltransferase [Pseudomonas sp. W4I3]|uniref:glycosyltransferase n=1 Tax=Pseudomonas sp. W4I3 TaxID=3042294 RepID=UPI00278024EC|nr:glycosyltransferase [Pseudomonas sp. W4I3]MDQ0740119.1 hypothetical protein [Pseudomonas sp. W4I3]
MNVTHHVPAHPPLTRPTRLVSAHTNNAAITPASVAVNDPGTRDTGPDEFDNAAALKEAFAERCNWKEVAAALRITLEDANKASSGGEPSEQRSRLETGIAFRLGALSLPVCADSSYYRDNQLTPSTSVVKLTTYLSGSGLELPKTLDQLLALYQKAMQHVQTHPLGNFSGALAWPTPMAAQDQQAIIDLLNAPDSTLPNLPLADLKKGALGYLLSAGNLSNDDLKQPSNATQTLLSSAKAQALGQLIQAKLKGIATPTSINDYLLAAIHIGLDPESLSNPARNSVAGFDLGQSQHWRKSPTVVIEGLSRHLVTQGRASPQSADLAARVLLARTAPEHLVKNIPSSVTYGSIPWTQLVIAAAKLEAQSPGCVLTMSYSEVMAGAESVDVGAPLVQQIQRAALSHWAAANGLLNTLPAPADADIRRTFVAQQNALQAASTALATPIPDREAMGLELLRQEFPGVEDSVFRARHIIKTRLHEGRPGRYPGEHSMLDIVMHGDTVNPGNKQHWITKDKQIPIEQFCEKSASGKLTVDNAFTEQYTPAIEALEKGHTGMVQYLISALPPQDRVNLRYGQLEFFHKNEYKLATDFWNKSLSRKGHTLDVKTTLDGKVNVYRLDTSTGTVSKLDYLSRTYSPPYDKLERRDGSTLHKTVRFNPFESEHAEQSKEQPVTSQNPQVFDSDRTRYIAKVFTQSLDLHSDDVLQHARGSTSYDQSTAADEAIGEFFLNLIPFRSAIVNFSKGKVGDGVFDLGLDVVGLVTMGIGKAAQAGKVIAKGVNSVKAAAKAARFLGSVVTEALNPLGGAGDVLRGAGWLARRGAKSGREAINVLKGASSSYDLLKAAGVQHGLVGVGTYKLADRSVEGGAVFRNGDWYAYDVTKGQPYGAPLKSFEPGVVTTGGEVKVLDQPALFDYEVTVDTDRLHVKGLQANVYIGANNQEYVKIDGRFYQSKVEDGQRVVLHPTTHREKIPVRDLGSTGWEPAATANRLLGGENDLAPAWKLDNATYVVPMDGVKVHTSVHPILYSIDYGKTDVIVYFDTNVGAWRENAPLGKQNAAYFWTAAKDKWQKGSLAEFKSAKPTRGHTYRFIDAPAPSILQKPKNVRPVPKKIHYFWAGGEIPSAMINNIAKNAEKMPGYTSIVHIDADTPELFQAIKLKLQTDAPGATAMNLNEEDFFQSLKDTDMYSYFRRGQGKNLSAASDVTRYPLMNQYGGIYLDTDDLITGTGGSIGLNAGDSDILLGAPVGHKLSEYKPFYNTSHFATQAENPVITEMITEMNNRFTQNKAYFEANRLTVGRDAGGAVNYTPDFLAYGRKYFETVGPLMFDDVLKAKRPDIYDVGFDGKPKVMEQINGRLRTGARFSLQKQTRDYYLDKGLIPPDGLQQSVTEAKEHYLAMREQLQIEIGGEHSWIDT